MRLKVSLFILGFVAVATTILIAYPSIKKTERPYNFTDFSDVPRVNTSKSEIPVLGITPADDLTIAVNKFDDALESRDFHTADTVMNEVITKSAVKNGRYLLFGYFINTIAIPKNDDAFLARLNDWVNEQPNTANALIIRGNYYYKNGWYHRGNEFAPDTPDDKMNLFVERMKQSAADLEAAVKLQPKNPSIAVTLLQIYGVRSEWQKQASAWFQHIDKTFPDYYWAYDTRLSQLAAKWSGSRQAQESFANFYTQQNTRPLLKFLYLRLYGEQIKDERVYFKGPDILWQKWMDDFIHQPTVKNGIYAVLDTAKSLDPYTFNELFISLADSYSHLDYADVYSDAFYQMAHERLGDENYAYHYQLAQHLVRKAFRNGQMQSDLVRQGIEHYKKAAELAETFHFPNDYAKNERLGFTYGYMALAAHNLLDNDTTLTYGAKALHYYSTQKSLLVTMCSTEQALNHNQRAIAYCDRALKIRPFNDNEQAYAFYARGMAKQRTDPNAAIADMAAAIPYADAYLAPSAIMMQGFLLSNQKEDQKAIAVYKAHPEIFDPQKNRAVAAAAYNNLCQAYRHTKDYEQALQNCETAISLDNTLQAAHDGKATLLRLMGR